MTHWNSMCSKAHDWYSCLKGWSNDRSTSETTKNASFWQEIFSQDRSHHVKAILPHIQSFNRLVCHCYRWEWRRQNDTFQTIRMMRRENEKSRRIISYEIKVSRVISFINADTTCTSSSVSRFFAPFHRWSGLLALIRLLQPADIDTVHVWQFSYTHEFKRLLVLNTAAAAVLYEFKSKELELGVDFCRKQVMIKTKRVGVSSFQPLIQTENSKFFNSKSISIWIRHHRVRSWTPDSFDLN